MQATPGEHKCIHFYYANITALSAQAKAFLATNYVNKFHLVGLAETHVVDRSFLKQFSKTLGRQVFQRPASTTTGRYSSGGEAILPLNSLAIFPVPRSLAQHLPFPVCQLRVQKLSILVAVFYARPGEQHQDLLTQGLLALGALNSQLRSPFIMVGDFNTTPNNIQPEILKSLKAITKSPTNSTSTLKNVDNRIIDFCIVSSSIAHLVDVTMDLEGPWSPHFALNIKIHSRPMIQKAQYLKTPIPLPLNLFAENAAKLSQVELDDSWSGAQLKATQTLNKAKDRTGYAILGKPSTALIQDTKYNQSYLKDSISTGEQLAHAALATEYHVLNIAKVPETDYHKYIGRSQFPRFITKPIISKSRLHYLYKDPQLNSLHVVYSILIVITRLMNKHNISNLNHANPNTYIRRQASLLSCHEPPPPLTEPLKQGIRDGGREVLGNVCVQVGEALKIRALEARNTSSLFYKKYVRSQLFAGGGRLFQQISKQEKIFLNVDVNNLGKESDPPQSKVNTVSAEYFKLWDPDPSTQLSTKVSFNKLRQFALDSAPLHPFTTEHLILAAKNYKKRSRGCDHWDKEEVMGVPPPCQQLLARCSRLLFAQFGPTIPMLAKS